MFPKNAFCLSLFLLTVFLSPGCAYLNPYIQDFNIVSFQQEAELGEKVAEAIEQEMPVLKSGKEVDYVRKIGNTLVNALPRKEFDYQFNVVKAKDPNAFAIPGGSIYVHTGLLEFLDSDDELAGVLAHEIGHVYERHPAKALSRTYGIQYLSSMLFKDDQGNLQRMALGLAQGTLLTKYGRHDERESDVIGYYLLQKTPYAEDGLLTFLRKLQKISGEHPAPFLSTHPPTPERIARLENMGTEKEGQINTTAAGYARL